MKILHCLLIIAFIFAVFAQSYENTRQEDALLRDIETLKKHKDDSYQEYLRVWRQLEDAKADAKDGIRKTYETTNTQYQQSRDKFVSDIKQALETAKNKYHEERDQLRKSIEDLKAYKDDKQGQARDTLESAIRTSERKYRDAKNVLSKYYNQVYDELYADYGKAKELAASAKDQFTKEEAQKLYASAKVNLREAYDRVTEFGQSSLETARDLLDTLKVYSQYYAQKAADSTKGTYEAAKQTVAAGLESAKETVENAKQSASENVDSAQRSASQNLDAAKQSVTGGVNSAKRTAANGVDSAQQTASETLDSIKETAASYYNSLEQEYEVAKAQAADFIERAKIWFTEDDNVHRAKLHATHDTAEPHFHQDL